MIVAPVVVKPDMASKKASVKLWIYPLIINGSVPNSVKRIQATVTTK